jgi:hypothetical protein
MSVVATPGRGPPPAGPPAGADRDAARLRELGYTQQLARRLRAPDNAAVGFAAISPVVGLYAVVLVGTAVAGPAWVWVLPVALAGQCLLLWTPRLLAVAGIAPTPGRIVGRGWCSSVSAR